MKRHCRSQSQSSNSSWQMANFIGRLRWANRSLQSVRTARAARPSGGARAIVCVLALAVERRAGRLSRTARVVRARSKDVGCNAVPGYVPQTKEQGQADAAKCGV